jgi:hypothetical protein
MKILKWFSLMVIEFVSLALFMGCSTSSDHMGSNGMGNMGNSGWGQMWYYWLIPVAVLALVAWIVIRITNRNRGPRE